MIHPRCRIIRKVGRTAILGSRRLSQWFYRVGRSAPGARTDFLGMDDCRQENQVRVAWAAVGVAQNFSGWDDCRQENQVRVAWAAVGVAQTF